MRALSIMAAYTNTMVPGGYSGVTNGAALVSADPREVATLTGDSQFEVDLGEPKLFDTLFFGYNTFGGDAYVTQVIMSNDPTFGTGNTNLYSGFAGDNSLSVTPAASNPRVRHGVLPVGLRVARYLLIRIHGDGALGVFAVGNSFSARWGHEMGSGRPLLDRSSVEALPLGGFGVDAGAITGGYQWSFGDLQAGEIAALYQIIKSVGQSRSVLVIEDPDFVYDTPTVFGSAALSGGNKIITKPSGGGSYNAGATTPFRDGKSTAISFKNSGTGGRLAGFWSGPNGTGTAYYTVQFTNSDVIRVAPTNVTVGAGAVGARGAIVYDEGRQQFRAYQDGVLMDVYPAPTGLGVYPAGLLFANADQYQEFNVFDLAYEDRIHWGLLQKLDTFERADPANWRWSLSVGDWV